MAGLSRVGSRVSILSRHSQSSYKNRTGGGEHAHLVPPSTEPEESRRLSLAAVHNNNSLEDYPDTAVCSEIIEARKQSLNSWDFLQRSSQIFQRSQLATVLYATYTLVPLSMIFMGGKYLDGCPKERKIPVYLLVGGSFGLVKILSILWEQMKYRSYEPIEVEETNPESNSSWWHVVSIDIAHALFTCFLAAWFCLGNYWFFKIWPPEYVQNIHRPTDWCDKTLCIYTLAQIISCQITITLVLLVISFLVVYYKCKRGSK